MTVQEIKQFTYDNIMNRPDLADSIGQAVRLAHHDVQMSVFTDGRGHEHHMEWPCQFGSVTDITLTTNQRSLSLADWETPNRKIKRVVSVVASHANAGLWTHVPRITISYATKLSTANKTPPFSWYQLDKTIYFTGAPATDIKLKANVVFWFPLPGDNETNWFTDNIGHVIAHRAAFYGFIWTGETALAGKLKVLSEEMAVQALKAAWRDANGASWLPPGMTGLSPASSP